MATSVGAGSAVATLIGVACGSAYHAIAAGDRDDPTTIAIVQTTQLDAALFFGGRTIDTQLIEQLGLVAQETLPGPALSQKPTDAL